MYKGERTFGNLVWKFQTPLIARNPLTSSFDLYFLEMTIKEILMVKNALNNCDLQHTILPLSSYHPPFISLMSLMPLCQLHVRPQCLLTHKHSQNFNPVQNWVFVLNSCDSQESRRDLFSDHLGFNVQNEIGGKSAGALPMLRFVSQVCLLLHKVGLFLHNICLFLIKAGLFLHEVFENYSNTSACTKQDKTKWETMQQRRCKKQACCKIVSRWAKWSAYWEGNGNGWHTCLYTMAA